MNVIIIHELDLDDKERSVIGVSTSVEKANKLINEHYGEFKEISFRDIRDSGLEYSKVIEIKYSPTSKTTYQCELTLEWFTVNEL